MPFANLTEYRQQANYSQLCGHRIAQFTEGEGEALVLLHGFPSAAWDWHLLWPVLIRHYKVYALDFLGFGLSAKPYPHRYSLLEQADIVEAMLAQNGIRRCHVLAHDYGDSVAQELLSRVVNGESQIELLSVSFLNGGLFSESHRPLLTQKLLKSPLGPWLTPFLGKSALARGLSKIFGAQTPPCDDDVDVLWALLREANGVRVMPPLLQYLDERRTHGTRWRTAMQTNKVPMQFVNGVRDPISGQHMLERYCQLIADARVSALNVGHYPQLEDPQAVLAALELLLPGTAADRGA